MGGPHLHFEIRYYRAMEVGNEEYYGWSGGSTTFTTPSAGSWSYGYWNPNIAYGFANPMNHLSNSSLVIITNNMQGEVKIFPNPTRDVITIDFNTEKQDVNFSLYDLTGKLLEQNDIISTSVINISLTHYNSGVYFVSLIDKESKKRLIMKVIKE